MAYQDEYAIAAGAGVSAMGNRIDPLLASLHESVVDYKNQKDNPTNQKNLMHSVVASLDADLSMNERILAADILITLVKQAEKELRINLANKLAYRDDLPVSLLHYLIYGEIDMAEPVLLYSPLLSETDLMYIVQAKGSAHWQAIASRENISSKIVDLLGKKKDKATNLTLLKNDTITLDIAFLEDIKGFAVDDESFAKEYVNYKTLPKSLAVSVYWHLSVRMRQHIMQKFDVKADELDKALEDCCFDFRDTIHNDIQRPTSTMIEAAKRFKKADKITEPLLVQTLRQRQGRFFVALFCEATGMSIDTAADMLKKKNGHSLAVSCRVLKITKEGFVSIFLLARAITTPDQAVSASELQSAVRYFEMLNYQNAKEVFNKTIIGQ